MTTFEKTLLEVKSSLDKYKNLSIDDIMKESIQNKLLISNSNYLYDVTNIVTYLLNRKTLSILRVCNRQLGGNMKDGK